MRTYRLGLIICLLLLAACAAAQGSSTQVSLPQSTAAAHKTTPTQTSAPPSPTNTPTQTDLPSSPTSSFTPSTTVEPDDFSHPELTADSLSPGSHTPFSFLSSSGEEVRYLLYLPEDFDLQSQWPIIISFHGHGGKGKNINRIFEFTLPELLETKEGFPFIVLSPQLPSGFWTEYIEPVDELIDYLGPLLSIDSDRLYLTGFSVGGYGAWRFALRYPDRFAAVAPVAGIASLTPNEPVPEEICDLKDLPIWVFHGDADMVIPPEVAIAAVEALQSCAGNVKFTLYPEGSHEEALINTYSDTAFYEWLLENER